VNANLVTGKFAISCSSRDLDGLALSLMPVTVLLMLASDNWSAIPFFTRSLFFEDELSFMALLYASFK
jgi:hypothetical protein